MKALSAIKGAVKTKEYSNDKSARHEFFQNLKDEIDNQITKADSNTEINREELIILKEKIKRVEKMADAEHNVQFISKLMDSGVRLDAIIGLIPGIGDGATLMVQLYPIFLAMQFQKEGIGKMDLAKMSTRVAIDAGVGAIPLVGDVFDWFYRASRGNAQLFTRRLDEAMEAVIKNNWHNKEMMNQVLMAKKQGLALLSRIDVEKMIKEGSTNSGELA